MILRALESDLTPAAMNAPAPAWSLIEREQQGLTPPFWLITQPAHAALSGEMAAALRPEIFGRLDPALVRAIALHDYGWSGPDAQMIQLSRSARPEGSGARHPRSFLEVPTAEMFSIWSESIDAAAKVAPAGGWIVAEHFLRIAALDPRTAAVSETFVRKERHRQGLWAESAGCSRQELERFTDALQFCDLFSLYVSCGIGSPAEFPQTVQGAPLRFLPDADEPARGRFKPPLFNGPQLFSITAIRHPRAARNLPNSALFTLSIEE